MLSTSITGTNDLMAKKPGERAATDAPKDKTEDPAVPDVTKRAEGTSEPKGAVDPVPVEAPDRAAVATATEPALLQSFDEPTIVARRPIPREDEPKGTPADDRALTEPVAIAPNLGRPPEMPTTAAPAPLALGDIEDPTHMPGPRDIPSGEPGDRAPAPGRVPPGDSRSLRKTDEFALIYRLGTYVVSRYGAMGTRGQWRVVEYPTPTSAAHSYAKECSRFVSEGFSDYRG